MYVPILYISRRILRWTDLYIYIYIYNACTHYTRTLVVVSIVLAPPINHIQVYSAHADYYTTDQGGGGGKETTVVSAPCPPGCLRSWSIRGRRSIRAAATDLSHTQCTLLANYYRPAGWSFACGIVVARGPHTHDGLRARAARARSRRLRRLWPRRSSIVQEGRRRRRRVEDYMRTTRKTNEEDEDEVE